MARSRKNFTPKLRHEAINLVLEQGMSTKDAAKKKGVGNSTLSKWVTQYKNNNNKIDMDEDEPKSIKSSKEATPNQSELQELRNKNKRLKHEKEVLKKTISILMSDD